ncbi:MAG TPA: serine hydrolase [Candidatus Sulfomarinibacteraceae bacterium]|nr:serine hydrolase [Candidatus Sulfomarinibacteraceae bacterium]
MTTRRALAASTLVVLAAVPAHATEPERTAADELRSVAEVQSLIVLRGGSTALEWYRTPADAGPTNIKSASKSVLSALVGIALDRRLIADLDTPVVELLPTQADLLETPAKRGITLRHLLSMTAGLESTSQQAYGAWVSGENWLRGALSRPMVSEPGEDFIYSTGSSHAAAAILDRASSPPGLVRWAREVLFDPAGIGPVTWQRSPEGLPFGGNNMAMTPRDLARFGRLWLAEHPPGGDPLLPASWIETATSRQAEGWPDRYGAYGLGWWLPGGGPFLAVGFGGQLLWVDPEHDSVVVVTSDDTQKPPEWDRRVLELVRRVAADD